MSKILFTWIGQTDLDASKGIEKAGLGPIAPSLQKFGFDQAVLLNNYADVEAKEYLVWLRKKSAVPTQLRPISLSSPMNFGEVYQAAVTSIIETMSAQKSKTDGGSADLELYFHISPGTSAMAAVWILLSKTRFPATLIQSSRQKGVEIISVPFDISADYIPDLLQRPDRQLERLSAGILQEAPEFKDIIHRSPAMIKVIAKARRIAPHSVPVLIEGESGTGKELLAHAIHRASPRAKRHFVPVNCGAIPSELVESELFGHERGAFTGAVKQRIGHFEEAHEGTLFLDEIGELPLPAQVKLLRVLQEKEIVRVGSSRTIPMNVRIIAATNRSLIQQVKDGRFRGDLLYRLAVIVLKLPALRERPGDVSLLIDYLLSKINREGKAELGFKDKIFSAAAKNLLLNQAWPGNVRELHNTILRAAIWSDGNTIQEEDVAEALLTPLDGNEPGVLNRPLGDGLNLQNIMALVARHYLERAMLETHGNKTRAAALLSLPNYQTLSNWLKKFDIKS